MRFDLDIVRYAVFFIYFNYSLFLTKKNEQ